MGVVSHIEKFLEQYPGSVDDTATVYMDNPFQYTALAITINSFFRGSAMAERYAIFDLLLASGASTELETSRV